jgi:hypothetical protein
MTMFHCQHGTQVSLVVAKQGSPFHSERESCLSKELVVKPVRVGFNAVLVAKQHGDLAFCESVKTWVLLGAGDGTTWQEDGNRVAKLIAAQKPLANGTSENAACTKRGLAAAPLLETLEEDGIVPLSVDTAHNLQQQCSQMLLSEARLVAEAFQTLWQKEPWQVAPAQVRRAMPKSMDLSEIERLLGHQFLNPLLVLRALTHSSFMEVWASGVRKAEGE